MLSCSSFTNVQVSGNSSPDVFVRVAVMVTCSSFDSAETAECMTKRDRKIGVSIKFTITIRPSDTIDHRCMGRDVRDVS